MASSYFIIFDHSGKFRETFESLISLLKTDTKFKVEQESEQKVILSLGDGKVKTYLEVIQSGEGDDQTHLPVKLTFESADLTAPYIFKDLAIKLNYRIFNPILDSYIPLNPYLVDATTSILKPEIAKIFQTKKYEPLFHTYLNGGGYLVYARPEGSDEIHIINPYMLDYFMNFGVKENEETPEFSYKVANSIRDFYLFYEAELIPGDFYAYYQKSTKIINYTGFNIENPGRKVFVKPLVTRLDSREQKLYTVSGERSSVIVMDKIRPGENLDATLKRVLREELDIADDYIGAKVRNQLEFDRDREGLLIPRLVVVVYVADIRNEERVKEDAQKSWTPFKKTPVS